jgi:hypothetical protein
LDGCAGPTPVKNAGLNSLGLASAEQLKARQLIEAGRATGSDSVEIECGEPAGRGARILLKIVATEPEAVARALAS